MAERRSLTGPGKPYWKIPDGSTGGIMGPGMVGSSWRTPASGRSTPVRVALGIVVVVGVVVVVASFGVCLLDPPNPYIAAVVAAPTAADAPATMASVNFDMLLAGDGIQSLVRTGGQQLLYSRCHAACSSWSSALKFQKTRQTVTRSQSASTHRSGYSGYSRRLS